VVLVVEEMVQKDLQVLQLLEQQILVVVVEVAMLLLLHKHLEVVDQEL
jgi:hypothetical protein